MDDAAFVSVFECVGDLEEDLFGLSGRDWALRHAIGEGRAFDQFHHEGALFDAVNRRDPGMVELGEDFRFALEAGQAVGVGGEGVGEEFDGHFAVELSVERGRGRDSDYSLPPAQTRAGAASAHGSYLGCWDVWRQSAHRGRVARSGLVAAGNLGDL